MGRLGGGGGEGPAHDGDARGLDGHALVLDLLAHIPAIGSQDLSHEANSTENRTESSFVCKANCKPFRRFRADNNQLTNEDLPAE